MKSDGKILYTMFLHDSFSVCKIAMVWTLTFMCISVYNTCTILLTNTKFNFNANFDASDNVISVMNPHKRCLQAKVKKRNDHKQVMPKSQDLRRCTNL